jgi:hypothetical protein
MGGSLRMAEKLQQSKRSRHAIGKKWNQRSRAARTVSVDEASNELLARSLGAGDQHGELVGRNLDNSPSNSVSPTRRTRQSLQRKVVLHRVAFY